eukprot:gnl/Chilomastix_cuspidata/120.p1 GENE.gnl/Chilomastix_cuspidata/120~~gnl/Chilomastix_cuspidata/120.p1  ORF type:complete len:1209 (+),score=457.51 gnl/Chilomastix_cuspidata/120:22-3648(+)
MSSKHCADGNTAAAMASYNFIDTSFIFPITPSTPMSELVERWAAMGRKNIFGEVPTVEASQSELCSAAAMHGALAAGSLCSTYTSSQGLLLMTPNIYHIAGECLPGVFHVATRSIGTHTSLLQPDHGDIYSCRQTGISMLSSGCVQEAYDMACITHLAAIRSRRGFFHFFEGFQVSHQLEDFEVVDPDFLKSLVDFDALSEWRLREAANPENPFSRNVGVTNEIHWQTTEAQNGLLTSVVEIVRDLMGKWAEKTGRVYSPFVYVGHPQAESVVVMMGCASLTAEAVISRLARAGKRVGLVRVMLYRPFSCELLSAAIPTSATRVAVLDRTKEPGSAGEPLYLDVMAALNKTRRLMKLEALVGGRYGVSGAPFLPDHVLSVIENLEAKDPKTEFVVGITDDVTNLSLPLKPSVLESFSPVPAGTKEVILWGLGADGTIGAARNAISIISEHTDAHTQCNFEFDGKKSGGLTLSSLRFGPEPIRNQYSIQHADYIACHNASYVHKYPGLVDGARDGATFFLNCPWHTLEELDENLPGSLKAKIAKKHLRLFVVDAYKMAERLGLGKFINSITVMFFLRFGLDGLIPFETCVAAMKDKIRVTYEKKSMKTVELNISAIDATVEVIDSCQVAYPAEVWAQGKSVPRPPIEGVPSIVNDVFVPAMRREFDDLPVSKTRDLVSGIFPPNLSKLDKPGTAVKIPHWEANNCIQCNVCSVVCPHAVIRPFFVNDEDAHKAPDGFDAVPFKGAAPSELGPKEQVRFRIQVSPDDCRGCGLCIQECLANKRGPGKEALTMTEFGKERDAQAPLWKFAEAELTAHGDLIDKSKAPLRNLQFARPYMEFNGACPGCNETPYAKLMTQLFGDRMVLAVGVGCCLVWGHFNYFRPYATDAQGRGPVALNSLFEDNAEFGYGMTAAMDSRREQLRTSVISILEAADVAPIPELSVECIQALREWVDTFSIGEANKVATDKLVALLPDELLTSESADIRTLVENKDMLVKQSIWIVGGDGWAYDIGFGGLDHVLASGKDVNVLVLDTNVYSNTGGQKSKATPIGAVAKFAAGGNVNPPKDIAQIFMTYGNIYVASVSLGFDPAHTIKALKEAESYEGPSIVVAYCPCINQGLKSGMGHSFEQEKLAVETGMWSLFRYDPRLEQPFQLDSPAPTRPVDDFLDNEVRFTSLGLFNPDEARRQRDACREIVARRQRAYRSLLKAQDE